MPVLLALTVAISSFAADGNNAVSHHARLNFENQFRNASDVTWAAGENFTKATFVLNNVRTEALYNTTGDFIGTNQGVTFEELPTKAKRAFAKKFAGYTVKEAVHFEGTEEEAYYFVAENEKGSVIIKVEDNGFISTVKK